VQVNVKDKRGCCSATGVSSGLWDRPEGSIDSFESCTFLLVGEEENKRLGSIGAVRPVVGKMSLPLRVTGEECLVARR
jgi:hypothetical protein